MEEEGKEEDMAEKDRKGREEQWAGIGRKEMQAAETNGKTHAY